MFRTLLAALLLSLLAAQGADAATADRAASPACETPSQSVRHLVRALGDADADVRSLSAELLGTAELAELASAERAAVARALGARLADRDEAWRVRCSAANALATVMPASDEDEISAAVLAVLVTGALDENDDWRVRWSCVEAIAAIDDGARLRALADATPGGLSITTPRARVDFSGDRTRTLAALGDADPRVRRLATLALATTLERPVELTRSLLAALDDEDEIVRERATTILLRGLAPLPPLGAGGLSRLLDTAVPALQGGSRVAIRPVRLRQDGDYGDAGLASSVERALRLLAAFGDDV